MIILSHPALKFPPNRSRIFDNTASTKTDTSSHPPPPAPSRLHLGTHQPRNACSSDTATDFDEAPAQIVVLSPKATFEVENDGRKTERDALDGVDEDGKRNWAARALTSREMLAVVMQLLILSKNQRK